jgi:twinkle protein
MGSCITKIAHKECGSGDGLQVFAGDDGNVNGWCFACATYVENPYGEPRSTKDMPVPKPKSDAEIAEELSFITGLGCTSLPTRKLHKDSLEAYGIKVGVSEQDGTTPNFVHFPYRINGKVVAYKTRLLNPKKQWCTGRMKGVEPFGWQEAVDSGSRKLIITEGEFDAVALHRIFRLYTKKGYEEYIPAVISLANGASSAKSLAKTWRSTIERAFDEVAVCFDGDEAGQKAVEEICRVWPGLKTIQLPKEDANECILQGVGKAAFRAAQWKAEEKKNTRIIFGEDLHEQARTPPTYGELTWPWEHINSATKGLRLTNTIYLGAGVKMGKSTILNEMAANHVQQDKVKVFMAKPEEANAKTYKLMAGAIAGKVFHDPDVPFDEEAYDLAGDVLRGNLSMVNLYQHLGWKSLREDIYAASEWGAKALFIDPITNLTNGVDSSEANTILQGVAQDLSAIALDLGILIYIFCHLKAPQGNISYEARQKHYNNHEYIGLGNCAHEMGGSIYSNQFAGSRAMMRSCNMMVGIEGNKDPELDKHIRNIRRINILEEREFGAVGTYPIYFNDKTWKYEEM